MLDQHIKIVRSSKNSAQKNMYIDTELLNSFDGTPIFRVYSWEENSLSIGVSQDFDSFKSLQDYKNSYAKRMTGGGVLFHGDDISYSLVVPSFYTGNLSVKKSYEKICTFLLDFYCSLGLEAMYAKDDENISLSKSEFCQVGFEPYDILIEGKKIGGNAQKRTKKAIFQHGSIPLRKNKHAYSLEDFGVNLSIEEAQKQLISSFKKSKVLNAD